MLVKDMISMNLVEAHIMIKRYWFPDLVFVKGPAQSIITLLNGSKRAGMGLRGASGLASLPSEKCEKFCKILLHSAKFEAKRKTWFSCCRFYCYINGHSTKTHEPISISHLGTILVQQSGVLLTIPQVQGYLVDI